MPGMALLLFDLQNLTNDELVKRHDEQAKTTVVGTQYYQDELNRRSQDRQTRAMLRFTKWIMGMTAAVTVATIVNVVIATKMWLSQVQ